MNQASSEYFPASTASIDNFMQQWEHQRLLYPDAAKFAGLYGETIGHVPSGVRIFPMCLTLGNPMISNQDHQNVQAENMLQQTTRLIDGFSKDNAKLQENVLKVCESLPDVLLSKHVDNIQPHRETFYILVPPSVSALINLTNIESFLHQGEFHQASAAGFASRPKTVLLSSEHLVAPTFHTIKAIDDPSEVPENEWDKVLACIVIGKEWQFDGWFGKAKGEQYPISFILNQIPAFYLCPNGELVPKSIMRWNASVVRVDKSKKDVFTARLMWENVLGTLNRKVRS